MISKAENWLNQRRKKGYFQHGEEGVLQAVFERVQGKFGKHAPRWCVEFGAGRDNINTRTLIEKGWHGILIETNPVFFKDLSEKYRGNTRVTCLHQHVGWEGKNSLDHIFKKTPLPFSFDLLVIDVDGNDIHMWESLRLYEPKVVMIEYNGRVPATIVFAQPKDADVNWGSSLAAIVKIGKEKGYELVYAYAVNAIFVKKDFFFAFEIANNSPEAIEEKYWPETRWFQLFDGTIVLNGVRAEELLSFKKKVAREPVYLLETKGLRPLSFKRNTGVLRFLKNIVKKTPFYSLLYPAVSTYYGRLWQRKKEKLKSS